MSVKSLFCPVLGRRSKLTDKVDPGIGRNEFTFRMKYGLIKCDNNVKKCYDT